MASVKWQNAARFKLKISKLPVAVGAAVREAMEEAAGEMVASMKRLVPVDTGALRDSIDWCWGTPPRGTGALLTIGGGQGGGSYGQDRFITIFAGSEKAFWARWVEFGTRARAAGAYRDEKGKKRNAGARGHAGTPAEPFFYPTWRAQKRAILGKMTRRINAAIKKIAMGG